ncbi:carboxypeptidase-like regulatory domain-containing protein, partial [Pontimicrobium sp. MEBiC01747]
LLQNSSVNFFRYENNVVLTKNSTIYSKLPEDFFQENTNTKNNSNEALFYNEYDNKNLQTVGKQNQNNQKQEYTLKGRAINENNGTPIEGLIIAIENTDIRTTTNKNGRFSLKVPSGPVVLETKLLGYDDTIKELLIYGNGSVKLQIPEAAEQLDEVLVESSKNSNVKEAVLGVNKIDVEGLKNIPVVFGERDILKIATTLPGITTTGEGSAGFNVRGGRADQNLILLDDAVIY